MLVSVNNLPGIQVQRITVMAWQFYFLSKISDLWELPRLLQSYFVAINLEAGEINLLIMITPILESRFCRTGDKQRGGVQKSEDHI